MGNDREFTMYRRIGLAAVAAGTVTAIAGALWAHFAGLDTFNDLGVEIYPAIPRGWQWELIGQLVSVSGAMLGMAGIALAFLYKREMTWARAAIGATLFSALMMVLFGIIPNEWLTLTQATLQWTPQKIAVTIPEWLVLNNEVKISYAVIKDAIAAGYVTNTLIAIAVVMYKWQEMAKKAQAGPPPQPVSPYGRPLTKTLTEVEG